ncbi:MAG: response regulator transcription factor [Burkholderiales bacterium]|jgi:DNA-binding response OmpR family regulator
MSEASTPRERRILVVEDEPDIAALLQLHLSEMPAQVRCECDGLLGLRAAQQDGPWDLLVLDLRLPSLGGLDICRQLRQEGERLPILMLTARSAELDRVLGLELGADDYLTKPFSVLELQARARALWRRVDAARADTARTTAPLELQAGALRLNREQRRAWQHDDELVLTQREFDLLWCFAHAPGRAFSRTELLQSVWGYGHDGYDHTVNTHINRLRNKLAGPYIHTVWGVGYRFEVPTA